MTARDDQTLAFPSDLYETTGMSLRDYFAAAALQGYLAAWPKDGENMITTMPKVAQDVYAIADAMLEARK